MSLHLAGASTASKPARSIATPKRTNDVLQKPDNSKSYRDALIDMRCHATVNFPASGILPEAWQAPTRQHSLTVMFFKMMMKHGRPGTAEWSSITMIMHRSLATRTPARGRCALQRPARSTRSSSRSR